MHSVNFTIAILTPFATLLPVLAIVFSRRGEHAPIAIRIDGRRYRNVTGAIEQSRRLGRLVPHGR